jgi:phosphoglycolate phosphatase
MKSKLLLFDIDGTLISARGIPRKAMKRVLQKRYDNFSYDGEFNFSGRTDWEIVEHLLSYDRRTVSQREVAQILKDFAHELQHEFQDGIKPLIHPGVENLLSKLNETENVHLGLVTGNISRGAMVKLSAAGLHDYFPIGGFGDDAKVRRELPRFAIERATAYYDLTFDNKNIWIIGDSIFDIDCAKVNNLRSLAVCTGWTPREELQKHQPEFLEDDLSDIYKIMNIFLEC